MPFGTETACAIGVARHRMHEYLQRAARTCQCDVSLPGAFGARPILVDLREEAIDGVILVIVAAAVADRRHQQMVLVAFAWQLQPVEQTRVVVASLAADAHHEHVIELEALGPVDGHE
jgi:hypothetical protein